MEVPRGQKRKLQGVSTLSARQEVVNWMIIDSEVNGEQRLPSRVVRAFPQHFRGTEKANIQKAMHWWANRDEILQPSNVLDLSYKTLSRPQIGIVAQRPRKARRGWGRKHSQWASWLYAQLLEEFERLRSAGAKLSSSILQKLARLLISNSPNRFNNNYIDPRAGGLIIDKISSRWIQTFMDVNSIVLRQQTGRLLCSPQKELHIEMMTTFHLGVLNRGFASRVFHEDYMENMDETHFCVNFDNGKTLGFRGQGQIMYADVVSGGDKMTMIVRITGGHQAKIKTPMVLFTNKNRAYPIQGIRDDVPGVCYRIGPRGWIDSQLLLEWCSEPRSYQPDIHRRMKHVWIDNCSVHNITSYLSRVLNRLHTTLSYLPPNTTHLVQPADTFIICKIKDSWTAMWDEKKLELLEAREWQNAVRFGGEWSGKLRNPGKKFFLQLAVESIRRVNS
jgi:hypothetical protein